MLSLRYLTVGGNGPFWVRGTGARVRWGEGRHDAGAGQYKKECPSVN